MQTLEDRFRLQMERHFGSVEAAVENVPVALWPYFLHPLQGQPFMPPTGEAHKPALPVVANHGRWLVHCPYCRSAQHASLTDRRFFCATCLNTEAGNKTLPVRWPAQFAEISALLDERPFVTTRNWVPSESVDELEAENRELLGGRS